MERVDAAGGMPLCSAKGAGWRRRCTAARVCLRRRRVWRWWLRRPRRRRRLRGSRKLWRRRDEPILRLRVHHRRHAIRWRSMHRGCHGRRKLDAGKVAEEATAGMKRPSRCRVRWCRRNLWRGRREPTLRRQAHGRWNAWKRRCLHRGNHGWPKFDPGGKAADKVALCVKPARRRLGLEGPPGRRLESLLGDDGLSLGEKRRVDSSKVRVGVLPRRLGGGDIKAHWYEVAAAEM